MIARSPVHGMPFTSSAWPVVSCRHAVTAVPVVVRPIHAGRGSATDRALSPVGVMVESRQLNEAGVSAREAEVLALVGRRLTNSEIASRLFISVRTVESHVSSLLRKLDVTDRRALAGLSARLADVGIDTSAGVAGPSLPSPLTSFVGRVAECGALAEALAGHRLVTAVGPGGVGKTRLALAVATDVTDRYADGAWYVDLVPVIDAAMVGAAVASVFRFGEQPGRSPTDTVVAKLAGAEALVVLDNCEHLVDGVTGFVERLLTHCPKVSVLATSRARLRLPFEYVYSGAGAVPEQPAQATVTRWRCSSSGPGWRAGRRRTHTTGTGSRRSAPSSTASPWRSSWPRPGWRPSASTGCGRVWPTSWAYWLAGLGSTTGTSRSAPPSIGASACSTSTTRWYCGERRCSPHRSRWRRRPRSLGPRLSRPSR